MLIMERTVSPIVLDRDGLALAQTLGAAGNLVLSGVGVSSDGIAYLNPPRPVSIFAVSDESGKTFTVYGTDRSGGAISQTITGPAAGLTVSTTRIFKTVTRIAGSAALTGNVEAGWTAVSYSSWIFLGNRRGHYLPRIVAFLPNGGTVSYDIEATSQNILRDNITGDLCDDVVAIATGKTAREDQSPATTYAAIRLKVNAQDQPVKLRVIPTVTV